MIALPIGRPIGAAGTQQNIDISHMHGQAPRGLPQIANRQIYSRQHRHCMAAPPLPRNRARLSTTAMAGGSEGSGAPGSDALYTSEDIVSQSSTTVPGELSNGETFNVKSNIWTAWREESTDRLYFHNEASGATQWVDPRSETQSTIAVDPSSSPPPLRPRVHSRAIMGSFGLLLLAVVATRIWAQLGSKPLKSKAGTSPVSEAGASVSSQPLSPVADGEDQGNRSTNLTSAPQPAAVLPPFSDAAAASTALDQAADPANDGVQSDGPSGLTPVTESSFGSVLVDNVLTDSYDSNAADADIGIDTVISAAAVQEQASFIQASSTYIPDSAPRAANVAVFTGVENAPVSDSGVMDESQSPEELLVSSEVPVRFDEEQFLPPSLVQPGAAPLAEAVDSASVSIGLADAESVATLQTTDEEDGSRAEESENFEELELQLVAAGFCIPHPAKVAKGGEDAYFVSNLHRGVMAVSDGVSGWAEEGIDPADYSRCLMLEAEAALTRTEWLTSDDGPLDILNYAWERTPMPGSATACVGYVQGGSMILVNLGDSGFRILRDGQCAFASQAQTHEFNTPYQLAHPDHVPETDVPDDGQVYEIELDDGDVIVMATDGLFDNVWDDDIATLVRSMLQTMETRDAALAGKIAEGLAGLAHSAALDPQSCTPWMTAAAPFLRVAKPLGGKMDDVTVVVGFLEAATKPAMVVPAVA